MIAWIHMNPARRSDVSARVLLLLMVIVGQCCLAPFSAMAMGAPAHAVMNSDVETLAADTGHAFCCDDAMGVAARITVEVKATVETVTARPFIVPVTMATLAIQSDRGPPPTTADPQARLQTYLI